MSKQSFNFRKKNIRTFAAVVVFFAVCFCQNQTLRAQTTAFTYQGKLTDSTVAQPTSGTYDFTFKLFSAVSGGSQIGADAAVDNVQVTAGIFTVNLDFGSSPFTTTTGNYLEIAVRPGASAGAYTTLLPRQPITSSPYSVQTIRAASAAVADNAAQLGGVNANQFVQTTDSRLTNDRNPLPNSPNYVQNTTTQQGLSNFNISGSGTVGGILTGSVVNATTQFNLGGNRVLSAAGTNNFFAGVGAGQNNTGTENSFVGRSAGLNNSTGLANSFFGAQAGQTNTTGNFNAFFGSGAGLANNGGENAFFGYTAGRFNTSGSLNSFFGKTAGNSNTTGSANSFFGYSAGYLTTSGQNNTFYGVLAGDTNTIGGFNTVIGASADVSTNNLSYATAIGADSIVSSSNTVVLGRNLDTVRIPGNLNVTGTFTGSFTVPAGNITGTLSIANGGTGLNSSGAAGDFLRSNGSVWTSSALQASDIPGGSANYIQNLGIGTQTGSFNINGGGTANIFNAATQYNIGGNRVLSIAGTDNLFVGVGSGAFNSGYSNSFFGAESGSQNTSGFGLTLIGKGADVGLSDLVNATAIGSNAIVSQSNSLVLGHFGGFFGGVFDTKVGIGTSAPSFRLHVVDSQNFGLRIQNNTAGGTVASFGSNGAFQIDSSNTPGGRLTILENGSVGIGITAPQQVLQVNGTSEILSTGTGAGFKFRDRSSTSSADDWVWYSTGNVANFFRAGAGNLLSVKTNGNVGIGTDNPNAKLQVVGGSVYISNPNSLIITSPNGACWFMTVNNAGALSTISVACP